MRVGWGSCLPVDHDEAGDMRLGVEGFVDASHDESDRALDGDAEHQAVLGAEPVAHEGADEGARDVEGVDEGPPAEDDP